MPVKKCSNGKYRIGSGDCIYTTKEKAESAYAGYRSSKYGESVSDEIRGWLGIVQETNTTYQNSVDRSS